jgi:hypothetical protein
MVGLSSNRRSFVRYSLETHYSAMRKQYEQRHPGCVVLLEVREIPGLSQIIVQEMVYNTREHALRDIEAHRDYGLPYLLARIPGEDVVGHGLPVNDVHIFNHLARSDYDH